MNAHAIRRNETATRHLSYPGALPLASVLRHLADELGAWPDRTFTDVALGRDAYRWALQVKWHDAGSSAVRFDDGTLRSEECGRQYAPDDAWCDHCEAPIRKPSPAIAAD